MRYTAPGGVSRPVPLGVQCRIRFSNKKFADSLGAIGLPRTIGETGDFIRRDHLLSEEPSVGVWEYLAQHLWSKYLDPSDVSETADMAAYERAELAEEICRNTNTRFSPSYRYHGEMHRYIHVARCLIEDLVGRETTRQIHGEEVDPLEDLMVKCAKFQGFGPGASTRLSRRYGDKAYKYSGIPETTTNNASLAAEAIASVPAWKHAVGPADEESVTLTLVTGNRVCTVPKNYKTNRTIAIEPCMNMYIQKGIGGFLRKRLQSVGIDLNDQKLNQEAAREGSLTGQLATIDLSMASDTVALALVKTLVPGHLYDYILMCRSEKGVLPSGEIIRYQKVSSMGNGFTFELESLIFWALAKAVVTIEKAEDDRVFVYGDDLAVSAGVAVKLIELLNYCGFTCNEDKTFITGPFKESCGKHFLEGHDITPFYIREPVTTIEQLMLLHNNLFRWRDRVRTLLSMCQWNQLSELLDELRSLAPAKYRNIRILDGFGDGGFLGNSPEIVVKVSKSGIDGVFIDHYSDIQVSDECCSEFGLLLKSLSRLECKNQDKWGVGADLGDIHPAVKQDELRRTKKRLLVPSHLWWAWKTRVLDDIGSDCPPNWSRELLDWCHLIRELQVDLESQPVLPKDPVNLNWLPVPFWQ